MELIFDLETLNYHYVLIGAGALLFLLGIGLGVIISKSSQTARKSAHTKPKNHQKKATEPVKPKEATSSPAKLLHRIASTLLRSGTQDECMAEFNDCTIAARMGLYSILGLHTTKKSNMSIHWQHVFSNSIAQFWLGSSTTNGIKLRGEAVADSTPCEVVNLLLNQDVVTGLEGLGGKNEIISRTSTENQIMIVRKVYCKAGSGSFMSSKRDFKIITTIKLKKNGSYVIATRSGPWDYEHSEVGGSTNSNGGSSGPVCPNKVDLTKGFIRGIVHASGYVLTPIVTDGIPGCEISFGCHVDMKGTRSGRGNTANVNLILSSVLRTIKSIQNGDAEAFAHLEGQSLGYIERVGSWSKMFTGPASGQQASAVAVPLSLELEADAPESLRERSLSMGLPTQSPHLFNASTPSTADKYRLLSVARDAANRMRAQYLETLGPDTRGAPPRTSFSGPLESRRETIHDQDGIVIREVIKD
ncbi:MAG: hypothetical protein B7Z05_01055 [Thiotrichales bacterium 32-46-8]|nr:MAG: hypothetical protein B7Z05_01055 [Thiotrichales bacterium 32-46-8]